MLPDKTHDTQEPHLTSPAAAEREWHEAIRDLDTALQDAAAATSDLAAIRAGMAVLEAGHTLQADGRNEAQRAAQAILAAAADPQHRPYREEEAACLARRAGAERRERIATERCRLARGLLALHAGCRQETGV